MRATPPEHGRNLTSTGFEDVVSTPMDDSYVVSGATEHQADP